MKTKEQLEQPVAEQWRNAFWRFINTGEADPAFLAFLDKDEGTQRALDEALRIEAKEVHALRRAAAPPVDTPKPGWWSWLKNPVLVRLYIAAVLSLGPGLAIAAFYWWRTESALQQVGYVAPENGGAGPATGLALAQKQDQEKKDAAARVAAERLSSPDVTVRTDAARLLAAIGRRAEKAVPGGVVDKLLTSNPEDNPALSAAIFKAVESIDPSKAAAIKPPATGGVGLPWVSKATDEEVQLAQDKKIDAAVLKLDSDSPADRSDAAARLAGLGDKAHRVFPELLKRWQAEKDSGVKQAIGDALKAIDLDAAEAANVPLATDAEKDQLSLLRNKKEVELAGHEVLMAGLQGLSDESPEARREAANALAAVGPLPRPAVLAIQKKFADEKDASVRDAIGKALKAIDPVAAGETVKVSTPAAEPPAVAIPPN